MEPIRPFCTSVKHVVRESFVRFMLGTTGVRTYGDVLHMIEGAKLSGLLYEALRHAVR